MSQPIRIELPFLASEGSVNVYLFVEPEPVLIDAGFNSDQNWAALQSGLAAHGLSVADLKRVIITHPHVDHYGLAARIARSGPAEVWMSEVGVDWVRNFPACQQRRIDYYRTTFLPALGLPSTEMDSMLHWMEGTLAAWEPIPSERIAGFAIERDLWLGGLPWQVLHLTGHDSHLTAFYQPETRQLLSADALIIPTATPVVEAPPAGQPRRPALPQMVHSLERLAQLDVETVHPGHGVPFGDHRTVIQGQIDRIHQRKQECWQLVAAGAGTVAEVFQRMYGSRANSVGAAGLWMVVGYLDLLVGEGQLRVDESDGLWRYRILPGLGLVAS
jgi:glyoxylase-like metal-dependent hydrolase (beta-lactamase superfamily II)